MNNQEPSQSSKTANSAAPQQPSLVQNWISGIGIILSASSFFAVLCLMAFDIFAGFSNPYMGILTYMVAPAFLIAGLAAIIGGIVFERIRRRKKAPGNVPRFPCVDFNKPRQRRSALLVVVIAFVFLLVTAVGSFRTYQFTESVNFCGKTCHSIMKPEYTAYQASPHARVACVQCHIGGSAKWYVKSKLSGSYQVLATIFNLYPRPIPAPIKDLRPAQESCEKCHWPQKFYGVIEKVNTHYLPSETNPSWTIRLLMKIGGSDPRFGPVGGIHWHMNIDNKIEYLATDKTRQTIPWIRVTDRHGNKTVYQSTDKQLSAAQIAASQPFLMTCIDCHNRPSHVYNPPEQSVNLAMSIGRIDPKIPFVKNEAVAVLTKDYPSTPEALRLIADTLNAYYLAKYAQFTQQNEAMVSSAIAEIQKLYSTNCFPEMKVNWRTYPNNIGHAIFPGCFRCHDGNHKSDDGKTITHDCNACHTIIAQGSGALEGPINAGGLEFQHPVDISDIWKDTNCSECHTGGIAQGQ